MTTQPSKPHLILINGIWHCGAHIRTDANHYGIGFTPTEAYEDWKKGGAR